MEDQGVIMQVTEPTEWSSYMVTVIKKDKVRICLDTTALKKVIYWAKITPRQLLET